MKSLTDVQLLFLRLCEMDCIFLESDPLQFIQELRQEGWHLNNHLGKTLDSHKPNQLFNEAKLSNYKEKLKGLVEQKTIKRIDPKDNKTVRERPICRLKQTSEAAVKTMRYALKNNIFIDFVNSYYHDVNLPLFLQVYVPMCAPLLGLTVDDVYSEFDVNFIVDFCATNSELVEYFIDDCDKYINVVTELHLFMGYNEKNAKQELFFSLIDAGYLHLSLANLNHRFKNKWLAYKEYRKELKTNKGSYSQKNSKR